jgi:hypothetical protein
MMQWRNLEENAVQRANPSADSQHDRVNVVGNRPRVVSFDYTVYDLLCFNKKLLFIEAFVSVKRLIRRVANQLMQLDERRARSIL